MPAASTMKPAAGGRAPGPAAGPVRIWTRPRPSRSTSPASRSERPSIPAAGPRGAPPAREAQAASPVVPAARSRRVQTLDRPASTRPSIKRRGHLSVALDIAAPQDRALSFGEGVVADGDLDHELVPSDAGLAVVADDGLIGRVGPRPVVQAVAPLAVDLRALSPEIGIIELAYDVGRGPVEFEPPEMVDVLELS